MKASPPALRPDRVRAIVFDLDGTLVDSYVAITESLNRAREAFGLHPLPFDEVRRQVGRGLESLVRDLVGPSRVEEAVRVFRTHYASAHRRGTRALPGASEILEILHRRGFRMAVASNKPAEFSEPILRSLGMRPHLMDVQGPDSAGHAKPDPRLIHACLRHLEAGPEDSVYVGDMVLDVESAARANLPVVLVPGGSSDVRALRDTGQTVIDTLSDLARLLPERPALARAATGGRR